MSEHENQPRHTDKEGEPLNPVESSKNKGSGFQEEHRDRKQSGLRYGHTEITTDENDESDPLDKPASKGETSADI